jgi:hypothetical protein
LDLSKIITELKSEQDRIAKAIDALLEGTSLMEPTKHVARKAVAPKRRGGMTPAGRRRQAAAMRRYWAARRAKLAPISKITTAATKAPAPIKRGGGLTSAGRKRLSELMKKRWAERKKKAS